jgi:hypothetical protein
VSEQVNCTNAKPTLRSPAAQRGHATVEYGIIAAGLATLLFAVPIPGTNQTAGQLVAGKIYDFYYYLTYFLSLP